MLPELENVSLINTVCCAETLYTKATTKFRLPRYMYLDGISKIKMSDSQRITLDKSDQLRHILFAILENSEILLFCFE